MNGLFKKILYATDLSENSQHALRYAVDLADKYKAQVTMLHVIPDMAEIFSLNTGVDMVAQFDIEQMMEVNSQNIKSAHESISKKIQEMGEEARKDLGFSPLNEEDVIIATGHPAEKILEKAAEGYDLVIIGTHGHGRIAELMMGSVARAVVRKSTSPVLVVRLPEHKE